MLKKKQQAWGGGEGGSDGGNCVDYKKGYFQRQEIQQGEIIDGVQVEEKCAIPEEFDIQIRLAGERLESSRKVKGDICVIGR